MREPRHGIEKPLIFLALKNFRNALFQTIRDVLHFLFAVCSRLPGIELGTVFLFLFCDARLLPFERVRILGKFQLRHLKNPVFMEGIITVVRSDDDVIRNRNIQQTTDLLHAVRQHHILPAGLQISGRMVVKQHDGGRIAEDAGLQDFSRVGQRGIQCSQTHKAHVDGL